MFRVNQTKVNSNSGLVAALADRISAMIMRVFPDAQTQHTPKLALAYAAPPKGNPECLPDTLRRRRRGRYGIAQVSDIKSTWY